MKQQKKKSEIKVEERIHNKTAITYMWDGLTYKKHAIIQLVPPSSPSDLGSMNASENDECRICHKWICVSGLKQMLR